MCLNISCYKYVLQEETSLDLPVVNKVNEESAHMEVMII